MEKFSWLKMLALAACMICSLGSAAQEAYANYVPSTKTLSFYYDNLRNTRTGKTYNLNSGTVSPGWHFDGNNVSVKQVVFDPSFADVRPTTAYCWFAWMINLESITGIQYLNTSRMTTMHWMFQGCYVLTSLDLSGFNTDNVTDMSGMFGYYRLPTLDLSSFNTAKVKDMSYMFCYSPDLTTIYVGNGWTTESVTQSVEMFKNCDGIVGGRGTTFDASHIDKAYAHIDGGPANPGYFTDSHSVNRGDVNGDGDVTIADVTALIDMLLTGNTEGNAAADCNLSGNVNIADVTALIDYLLGGSWD